MTVFPQHGGVPYFRVRFPAGLIWLLALVLTVGGMLSLMVYGQMQDGDPAGRGRFILLVLSTLLISVLIGLTGIYRLWCVPRDSRKNRRHHHHHKRRPAVIGR